MPTRSKSPKRAMRSKSPKRKASKSPKRKMSKSPKRKTSKSPKRKMSVGKATVSVVTLPVKMTAGAMAPLVPKRKTSKSPKRATRSKSPKRATRSKSPKNVKRVSKKPVAQAMMEGVDQKPEVVSMMAPLPAPGMIVGAAVADSVDAMTTPKPKRASRSKSPKKSKSPKRKASKSPKRKASKSPKRKASKSPKRATRSKSPKRAASPRKVKVLAFGMMPAEATSTEAKPMSPRRMSKAKSM